MLVKYRVIPGDRSVRPWLFLLVDSAGQVLPIPALVDSGSDRSSLPVKLGRALGFSYADTEPPQQGQGAGWIFEFWETTDSLAVQTEVGPLTLSQPLLTRGGIDHVLLGRSDFFNAFRVCFDERSDAMDIEPYDKPTRRN